MALSTEYSMTLKPAIAKRQRKLRVLFVFGIVLTAIQQMPLIRDLAYNEIRQLLYIVFGLVAYLSLRRSLSTSLPRFIKLFLIVILLSTAEMLLFQLLGWRSSLSRITELLVPFGILVSSYSLDFDQDSIDKLLMVYSSLAVLMGVLLVLYYGGGFFLREQYIAGTSKNQTGPILGIASVILFDRLVRNRISRSYKRLEVFVTILLLIGAISALVVLRNRAGLFGVLLVFALIILSKLRRSFTLLLLIILLIVVILLSILFLAGYLDPFLGIINDAFTMNYDITDLNSLSAGRISTYLEALRFVSQYPFFGELVSGEVFFGTAHNYVLNKWVSLGVVGSLPFVVLYAYLFAIAFRMLFNKRRNDSAQTALWILLLGLTISMFEYTYPYGPGVSQVMVWFCLGAFLYSENQNMRWERH